MVKNTPINRSWSGFLVLGWTFNTGSTPSVADNWYRFQTQCSLQLTFLFRNIPKFSVPHPGPGHFLKDVIWQDTALYHTMTQNLWIENSTGCPKKTPVSEVISFFLTGVFSGRPCRNTHLNVSNYMLLQRKVSVAYL